jgi:hypothetical protein
MVLTLVLLLLAQEEIQAVPGDPFQRLEGGVRASLEALDAAQDGWGEEVRSAAAQAQLKRLAHALEEGDPVELPGLCGEGFAWSTPGPLTLVRPGPPFRVRRPDPAAEGRHGSSLQDLVQDLGWGGPGIAEVHVKVKTIGVEDLPAAEAGEAGGFVTRHLVRLTGRVAAGRLQSDVELEARWQARAEAEPALQGLDVRCHEEVLGVGPGPLLADCTAAWLAGAPAWTEQLLPGLPFWRSRLDTRLGVPLLGHAAGVAVGDVDGDGLEDVYLCQPGGLPNKLLLHRPDGTVRDASAEAGVDFLDVSRSALLVDLDGDGDRDLAVTVVDRLILLSNDGHARFWLQAVLPAADATSLAAADVDLDGDLDLYVCAYASPYDHGALPVPYHDATNGSPNTLFENHGEWIFTAATEARGLDAGNDRYSFAASFEDFDGDGDPDLYVANDFGRNNLFRNDEGHFVDVAAAAGVEDVAAGMGVSWGDIDGDGRLDLYVSNMYSSAGNRIAFQRRFQSGADEPVRSLYQRHAHGNTLFRNAGDGTFVDVTARAGVEMGRWAWGGLFCDLDADGREDLLVPNGFVTETLDDDL